MNVIYAAYARALLDRLREILVRVNPHIILATHDSEAGLNDTYTRLAAPIGPTNWACNDFSEWDAHFRRVMARLTRDLIVAVGCPRAVADYLYSFRAEWTMIYRHKFGNSRLSGQEKQFSGNPFTICENTIANMALCYAMFDYKRVKLALFKGDDSAVACDGCDLTKTGRDLLHKLGHGLKLHFGPVGEFAGWFLTEAGFFPDVVRYAAKFVDKLYRDEKHFLEAKLSLQERVSAVKNQDQLRYGLAMCHRYYYDVFETEISLDELENLYAFIADSRSIRFDSLRPVVLPNLNANH